jgi:hypothetical protein
MRHTYPTKIAPPQRKHPHTGIPPKMKWYWRKNGMKIKRFHVDAFDVHLSDQV